MSTLALPRRVPASAVLVAAAGAAAVAVLLALRLAGADGFPTDPLATGSTAVAAVIAEVARARLADAGNRRAARVAAALTASLLVSLAAAIVAVAASTGAGPLASIAVAVWSVAWIPPLVLAQLTASSAVRTDGRRSPIHVVVVVASSLAVLAGIVLWHPIDPFAGVAQIAPEAWPTSFSVVGDLVTVVAIAALLLLPVTLTRAAVGSRGLARTRLALAAVGTAASPLVVMFCVLLAVARDPGNVDPTVGSVAFLVAVAGGCGAAALCAFLVARGPVASTGVLVAVRGTALVIAALLVAAVGTLVVAGGASPTLSALVVAAIAVLLTAGAWWGGGRLAAALTAPAARPVERASLTELTEREAEVLGLLAEGASNAGIAAQLVVSERTVDAHLRAVFTKLGLAPDPSANRRVQAARTWLDRAEPTR